MTFYNVKVGLKCRSGPRLLLQKRGRLILEINKHTNSGM